MGKTLSEDLRVRVIAAVNGGMSRNAAARRFDIAVSTAVRWLREWIETGSATAKPKGGDLRSHRIEAFGQIILGAIEARVDITLVELAEMLKRDHAASFAPSTIWRFLSRHGITIKKTRTPASKTGPTSRHGVRHGATRNRGLMLNAWCSSMKPAPRPNWRAYAAGRSAVSAAVQRSRTDIGRPQPSPALCVSTV